MRILNDTKWFINSHEAKMQNFKSSWPSNTFFISSLMNLHTFDLVIYLQKQKKETEMIHLQIKTKTFKYTFVQRLDLSFKSPIFTSCPVTKILKLIWGKVFCLEVNKLEENWRAIAAGWRSTGKNSDNAVIFSITHTYNCIPK